MAESKKIEPSKAPTYPLFELIMHAKQVFGVQPEVVQGAFHGEMRLEITVEEGKSLIEKFLKKEVK